MNSHCKSKYDNSCLKKRNRYEENNMFSRMVFDRKNS